MSRRTRSAHLSIGQTYRRFEWLECRYLLSFVVAEVDPSPGARLTTAPTALIVTFNQFILPFSLSDSDILLGEVTADGNLNWLDDASQELGLEENQLVLTPSQALAPGQYRILLRKESGLTSIKGETLDVDGTDEESQTLGDFWIVDEGVGLDDATDLGTPGAIPTSVEGALDFRENPQQVKLYKINLPAGHFWRLGLEVTSQRDGWTLDSALALFDDQGRPIAVADEGRRDKPYDPYLFTGLDAGTYYIEVSGTGDLPGSPGGYDLASATPGSVAQAQVGGPFMLHLVADPADTPIALIGMDLDRHDSRSLTPTGFTLQFSGVIRFESFHQAVEVVDEDGRTWPVRASHYLESEARISFLFQDQLPEGRYSVRLPVEGGLVDLAGLSPVAPGQPPSVLGEFSVGPGAVKDDPQDLGALLPGPGAVVGLTGRASLAPGESITYRVVITFRYLYSFQSRYTGGPLSIRRTGPEGTVPLDPGDPEVWNAASHMLLVPGEYLFRLTADGSRPVDVDFTVKGPFKITGELLVANGVGHGPALNLRLIAPMRPEPIPPPMAPETPHPLPGVPETPQDAPPPPQNPSPPPPPPSSPAPLEIAPGPVGAMPIQPGPGRDDTTPQIPHPTPDTKGGDVSTAPTSEVASPFMPLLVSGFVGDLVGRPSPVEPASVEVDPGSEEGGTASAFETVGILQPIGDERGLSHRLGPGELPAPDGLLVPGDDVTPDAPIPMRRAVITKESDLAAQEPISLGKDMSLRLGSLLAGWVAAWWNESDHDDGRDISPSAVPPLATERSGSTQEPFQRSSLISPPSIGWATAVGLTVLLTSHYRRRTRRFLRGRARGAGLSLRPGSGGRTGRGEGPT